MKSSSTFEKPAPGRVAYLCLQATREGQASYAHVHEIIRGLRRRGWVVDLYEPSYSASTARVSAFKKLVEILTVQARLWRHRRRYDAIYVRNHPGTVLTVLAARLASVPLIQELNGPYDDLFVAVPWARRLRWVILPLLRAGLKLGKYFVVGTDRLGDWLQQEVGPRKTYLIPNGANTDLFNPRAAKPGVARPRYAVFVGALAPWQGIDTILESLNQPKWPTDLHLVIAGDGVERQRVSAASLLDKRIEYLGRVPYREVPQLIAGALVALSPKNYDAGEKAGLSPLKLYEALACGVPVIVTDLPGQSELVRQHDCGRIIPQRDPASLARAVAWFWEHQEEARKMGERASAAIQNQHSWDHRAGETEKALVEIQRLRQAQGAADS